MRSPKTQNLCRQDEFAIGCIFNVPVGFLSVLWMGEHPNGYLTDKPPFNELISIVVQQA